MRRTQTVFVFAANGLQDGKQVAMETLEERIQNVVREDFRVVEYNPGWPRLFEQEKRHLLSCLPGELITRIAHFGSTAIPGMAAKPIVDILVEVVSLEETKKRIVPVLEASGYDYFWRPAWGDDTPPFYAWFIKRNAAGERTHHIHMAEKDFEFRDRLLFRDYLIEHPDVAGEYRALKFGLARRYPGDRIAYTRGKTEFIANATRAAKAYYSESRSDGLSR
jgi:GrpB-like predicted nucleotidyltransferase (UPF0157 family)